MSLSTGENRDQTRAESLRATGRRHASLFTWGRLEVLEKIGEGAFGEVYRAFEPLLQLEVALKLRKPLADEDSEAERRFLQEARRLARVRHPHVVIVHGADIHDGRIGLWTEFIHGKTLERYLEDSGPLSAREATLIGIDLCRALAAVHAAGLVHRDVKTSNAMREDGGRILLMDFGSMGDLPKSGGLLVSQHVHGTPAFMAPEQLRGEVAGPPTDLYALGVLLYRLVTKELPIQASTIPELFEKHLRNDRVLLRSRRSDLSTDFVQVVEKALAPLPGDRYATAGEMELALARTLHSGTKPRWIFAAAGAALILAGGALQWRGLEHRTPPQIVPNTQSKHTSLTATAALYRRSDPVDEQLIPGARVRPGDRIYLALEGSEPMYVYVLDEDALGNVYVLFPLKGMGLSNPLAPGVRYHLPGEGPDSLYYWTVTNAGQTESILSIASRSPLREVEQEIAQIPRAAPGGPPQYVKISSGAVRKLRGLGGVASESRAQVGTPSERLSDALAGLAERRGETGDLWLWQTQLRNPGR